MIEVSKENASIVLFQGCVRYIEKNNQERLVRRFELVETSALKDNVSYFKRNEKTTFRVQAVSQAVGSNRVSKMVNVGDSFSNSNSDGFQGKN